MVVQPELAFVTQPDSLIGPTVKACLRKMLLNKAGEDEFFDQVFGFLHPKSLKFTLVGVIGRGAKGAAFPQEQVHQAASPDLPFSAGNQGQATQDNYGNFVVGIFWGRFYRMVQVVYSGFRVLSHFKFAFSSGTIIAGAALMPKLLSKMISQKYLAASKIF